MNGDRQTHHKLGRHSLLCGFRSHACNRLAEADSVLSIVRCRALVRQSRLQRASEGSNTLHVRLRIVSQLSYKQDQCFCYRSSCQVQSDSVAVRSNSPTLPLLWITSLDIPWWPALHSKAGSLRRAGNMTTGPSRPAVLNPSWAGPLRGESGFKSNSNSQKCVLESSR